MYLFLVVALSTSTSVPPFGNYFVDFFETIVTLSAILLPIKSHVASAVFWIALFEAAFIASVVDLLALSRSFWPYYLKFYTASVISRCGTFSPFFSLVTLISVLSSNFIVSGVKSSRLYPFLILNVTQFSILFTYICTDGLSVFSPCFFKIYSK